MKLRTSHVSLQFSDGPKQHTKDIEKLFDRCVERRTAWITGTEAGPGAGNTNDELLRVSEEHDYRLWLPSAQVLEDGPAQNTDCWIAVREDLIHDSWRHGYKHAFNSSANMPADFDLDGRRWGPKGLVHVSFFNELLGKVNVGAAHYITGGRDGNRFEQLNRKLTEVIGEWAKDVARGSALAFYGGDQNINDRENDTFLGEALTSAWDELDFHQNTGHGNIDVIASYNKDKRVKAVLIRALNDKRFFLHGDHFLVEATYEVEPRPKKR